MKIEDIKEGNRYIRMESVIIHFPAENILIGDFKKKKKRVFCPETHIDLSYVPQKKKGYIFTVKFIDPHRFNYAGGVIDTNNHFHLARSIEPYVGTEPDTILPQ